MGCYNFYLGVRMNILYNVIFYVIFQSISTSIDCIGSMFET